MSFSEFLDEEKILSSPMNEMANLYPDKTGISLVIWFGEVGGQHGPRIKVSNTVGKFNLSDNFVLSVSKDPKILTPRSVKVKEHIITDIKDWIKLNYETLMEMWKIHESGDGDLDSVLSKLMRV